MSFGSGLGKLKGSAFRIGHLGSPDDLMLAGTPRGVVMGLALAAVPQRHGRAQAALGSLSKEIGTDQTRVAL